MAGEVFHFVGEVSDKTYGSLCLPNADDYETAYSLNIMYDLISKQVRWANTERLLVKVVFPEVVERSEI